MRAAKALGVELWKNREDIERYPRGVGRCETVRQTQTQQAKREEREGGKERQRDRERESQDRLLLSHIKKEKEGTERGGRGGTWVNTERGTPDSLLHLCSKTGNR